ncbi:MAG: SDR family NAD(P)-dependent oxidoreductase [Bryobacteraceae bacterium]
MHKIAIVLGATRGIGRALAKSLAISWQDNGTVYLTARRQVDGEEIVDALEAEGAVVNCQVFDLANAEAAAKLAELMRTRHSGVDIVVQNGAYMARVGVPAAEDARPMIEANSHGTLRVLRAFLPILRENGRMIVVASSFGVLKSLPEHLRECFITTHSDPDAINKAMDEYVAAVEAGTAANDGWPDWVNIPSKVGQVAVTRAFARWAKHTGALPTGALINAACPGLTLTDATREFMGTVFKLEDAQTPEKAAVDLHWLATLPDGTAEPFGELVRHRGVIPFGD